MPSYRLEGLSIVEIFASLSETAPFFFVEAGETTRLWTPHRLSSPPVGDGLPKASTSLEEGYGRDDQGRLTFPSGSPKRAW